MSNIYTVQHNKEGMPDLVSGSKPLSYFEFWPGWLFYFPMKIYAAFLALRYGGLTLPTITNPHFDVGGFVGESKSQILDQVPAEISDAFCTHVTIQKIGNSNEQIQQALVQAQKLITKEGIDYPFVAKPNIGARGAGVQIIYKTSDLETYIEEFPEGETIILQELADYPFEAGLFYIRKPGEEHGHITSLTLKFFPYVTGDGKSTLRELIENDDRAGKIAHIYLQRHQDNLDMVLADQEQYRIAFAGSHSRGTIFKNGQDIITEEMDKKWDSFCKHIPEFYFGRFDIRFNKIEDLQNCTNIKIIEINGAGAEATHIWDSNTKLRTAYKTLMQQYKSMFEIGAINKKRGFSPIPLKELIRLIRHNDQVTKEYPHTH